MSRRHASKARREARRVRQAAQRERICAPLPPGTVPRERREFSWTFRGGLKFELQLVGPAVPFDPAIHSPKDLPLMVVDELLRQSIPRPPGEPDVLN